MVWRMWAKSFNRSWSDTLAFMGGPQVLLAVVAIPAVGFLLHAIFGGPAPLAGEIRMWVMYGLSATGIVFISILIWNWACAPYRIERDKRRELEAEIKGLRERVTPKVACALEPMADQHDAGNTLTTVGGTAQTLWRMDSHAIKIKVSNITSDTLTAVRAVLIDAWRLPEGGDAQRLNVDDQIELAWNVSGIIDEAGASLLPGGAASAYVLVIRPMAVTTPYRSSVDLNRLPVKYHQMFSGNDRFRLRIGVYASSGGPLFFEIEVQNHNPPVMATDLSLVSVTAVE